jgi:hypothetical protein
VGGQELLSDPMAAINDDQCSKCEEALDLPFGRKFLVGGNVSEYG